MKKVEASACTVTKTLCPFCSFGCEFGVVFDDFGVRGVEYIKEGSSGGRLCPRGSGAAFYLNHPRRLSMPIKNGKPLKWSNVIRDLKKILEKPKNVAVTFDRNITVEEYQTVIGFCDKAGIKNIASTYFEPETFLRKFIDSNNPFSLTEIERAQSIIVLGDPFNYVPMISKALINWKLRDRKNRLVVIDSIGSHTSAFANDFLKVTVGTEALLLFGLARETIEGIDIPSATGVSESLIEDISQNFKGSKNGIIIVVLPFGHTYDPLLYTEGISRLSDFSGKRVIPFFEFAGLEGNMHFGSIVDLVKKKKIKHLINFGELFPYYYPQLRKNIKALNIVAASTLKYNDFLDNTRGVTMLPAALNIEKKGSILTTFGQKKLGGNIKPVSGARTVIEIVSLLYNGSAKTKNLHEPKVNIDIKERAERIIGKSVAQKKKTFKLVGEKIAYNFLSFFEKEMIKMNPRDARDLGVKQNDMVSVKSKHRKVDLAVKFSKDVDSGIVALPAEAIDTRGLFDFEIGDDIINFIPTEVEIWRRE